MIGPRWRKVFRDLADNKVRTLLVVLSIGVGVFAVGMIAGSAAILSNGLADTYNTVQPADVIMITDPFEEGLVEVISNMDGVGAVSGRRTMIVRFRPLAPGESATNLGDDDPTKWKDLQITALSDYKTMGVNRIWSEGGAWPPEDRTLSVERSSLEFMGVDVGGRVVVEAPNGRRREMQVGGVVRDMGQLSAVLTNMGLGYITLDTLQWFGEQRNFNQLYVRVQTDQPSRAYSQQVGNRVRDKLEESGRSVLATLVTEPGRMPATDFMQTMMVVLGVIGVLALLLSSFLVVNTISAILTQHIRQIGVMKTIGARTSQLSIMYFTIVIIFGLMALIIAVPLGALGARALAQLMANFLNFDISQTNIPTEVWILQISVGLLVPLLAALWPIISGVRLTVRDALDSYGLGKGRYGTGWIDRLIARVRGLPRPMLLSLRNTFRRKARLILTLVTLTLASTAFVVVFTVRDSLLMTLNEILRFWSYDIMVEFNRPYRIDQVEREAMVLPGVTTAEGMAFLGARRMRPDGTESGDMYVIGANPESDLINPILLEGRWLLPSDESAAVINADFLKNDGDVKVGDDIELKIRGREITLHVVGLIRGLGDGPYIFVNYPHLARSVRLVGRIDRMLIQTTNHDGDFQVETAQALKDRYKRQGVGVNATYTIATLRTQIETLFNVMVAFLMVMVILLGVVGGLGLMGTMGINVIERTREIGVMRAIGASTGSIVQIVLVEGVLIGILSWSIGVLLAFPISRVLSDAVGEALFKYPLSYIFSTSGSLLWLVIVVILATLASILPAWNASRLTVREVLAYE